MGLDMYLVAKTRPTIKSFNIDKKFDIYNPSYLAFDIGYWRKANAIHRYFDSLVGGIENCQDYDIPTESLKKLKEICEKILSASGEKQKVLAEELLPTQEGFFFGGTDLNDKDIFDCYLEDLKETIRIINLCEKFKEDTGGDCWFTYHAWW